MIRITGCQQADNMNEGGPRECGEFIIEIAEASTFHGPDQVPTSSVVGLVAISLKPRSDEAAILSSLAVAGCNRCLVEKYKVL